MKNIIILLAIFCLSNSAISTDIRLRSMGGMHLAVPDIEARINLYHLADNIAWLKANDSTNWSRYTLMNENETGLLRRNWDAASLNFYTVSISGQKHIDENKIFFGDIRYNVDMRNKVNKSLDKEPYDLDPFVLTDSTAGDFQYMGPEISVAFNHQMTSDFYWGASLDYNVNRGLKDIYTEPEIISRYIKGSLDFVYRLSSVFDLGITGALYNLLDITKLTRQSDGQSPQTFRYRGRYEFRKSTGTSDRNATHKGYQIRPQIGLHTDYIESVLFLNYHYRWHEIFDGTTSHKYDGYYQEQDFGLRGVIRYYYSEDRQSCLTVDYRYNYIENWAKEANADLLIHQANYNNQYLLVGTSRYFTFLPLLAAIEFSYSHSQPSVSDYLAHQEHDGNISKLDFRAGLELEIMQNWFLRGGYNFIDYQEYEAWDYYGDHRGHMVTGGLGVLFSLFELDLYGRYGSVKGKKIILNEDISREYYDFIFQLKHSF